MLPLGLITFYLGLTFVFTMLKNHRESSDADPHIYDKLQTSFM